MTPLLEALRRLGNAGAQANAQRSCDERRAVERRLDALGRRLAATAMPDQTRIAQPIAS